MVISMMHINLLNVGSLQNVLDCKNNPNEQKLIDALNKMIADLESVVRLKRKLESMVASREDGNDTVKILKSFIT